MDEIKLSKWQLAGMFLALPLIFSISARTYSKSSRKNNSGVFRVEEEISASVAAKQVSSNQTTNLGLERPLIIAMVGLPARGKSYLVKMLQRYLCWSGYECEVFNVGSFRRKKGMAGVDSNFFSFANGDARKMREELAMQVQDAMYVWLKDASVGLKENMNIFKKRVAIFDATNTTRSRRQMLSSRADVERVSLLFVESICTDEEVLQRNYHMKLQNEDYKGMDPDEALRDFTERVKQYEAVYETIEDDEHDGRVSYIKLINVGQKVISRNCSGYVASQVAFHLQNVHIQPRTIYLTLTSECIRVAARESPKERDGSEGDRFLLKSYLLNSLTNDENKRSSNNLLLSGSVLREDDNDSDGDYGNYDNSDCETGESGFATGLHTPGLVDEEPVIIGDADPRTYSPPGSRRSTHADKDEVMSRESTTSFSSEFTTEHLGGRSLTVEDLREQRIETRTRGRSASNPQVRKYVTKLTDAGYQYAVNLAEYTSSVVEKEGLKTDGDSSGGGLIGSQSDSGQHMLVLAGTSSVHLETIDALRVHFPCYNTPLLEELRAGDFHGLTRKEIKMLYPDEYRKRQKNKLTYRYPGVGGESYLDVIERVKPLIIELERQRNSVVVVCHLAAMRCIYAYFMGTKVTELPYLTFKKHVIYALSPGPFGCTCDIIDPSLNNVTSD